LPLTRIKLIEFNCAIDTSSARAIARAIITMCEAWDWRSPRRVERPEQFAMLTNYAACICRVFIV